MICSSQNPECSDTLRLMWCLLLTATHIMSGSILFDLVHWTAHQSSRCSNPVLRGLARIHRVHHQYFDRQLNFNQSFSTRNTLLHLTLELFCQVIGSLLSWQITHTVARKMTTVQNEDILLTLMFLISRTCVVAWNEGRDSNHIPYSRLPKDPHSIIVGPQYHALHHIDPEAYFGSMIRLVDWVFGTATTLRGRRITITGARGSLGKALVEELSKEKGTTVNTLRFGSDWNYDDLSRAETSLRNTDILILAHGSKHESVYKANVESAIHLIKTFVRVREQSKSLLLPEIWYIGSEAEFHGAWTDDMVLYTQSKRAFVPFARAFYEDTNFIYRHIVPAAFSSEMGQAIVSARWVARFSLWWIRRGLRYVPVTYTGIAFLNYFRFRYWVKPVKSD